MTLVHRKDCAIVLPARSRKSGAGMTRGQDGSLLLLFCGPFSRCSMPVLTGAFVSRLFNLPACSVLKELPPNPFLPPLASQLSIRRPKMSRLTARFAVWK